MDNIEYDYNELYTHVRKRPGLYVGSTNFRGVLNILVTLIKYLIECNKRNIVIDINEDSFKIQYENEQIPNCLDIDVIRILSSKFYHENNVLSYSLDKEIFGSTSINHDVLFDRFRQLAFLDKNIFIIYNGYEFHYKNGVKDLYEYFAYCKCFYEENTPFEIYYKDDNIEIDIAFSLFKDWGDSFFTSYVNDEKTRYGGSHVDGFIDGLKAVLLEYRKECCYNMENFWFLGFGGVIHVKKQNVHYYGATKEKVEDIEIYKIVNELAKTKLKHYCSLYEKLAQSNLICGHCRKNKF